MKPLEILIGCEESQAVTKEFRKLGHNAYSCDLQDCSGGHPEWHFKQDIFKVIKSNKWDVMIAFPPCTYLSSVQTHLCRKDKSRVLKRIQAANFFMELMNVDINYIALENPAGVMKHIYRNPDQTIQPYFFGDSHVKRTCLWLKNLPKLIHSNSTTLFGERTHVDKPNPSFTWINKEGKVKSEYYTYCKNAKTKSKTFPGIAKAMAEQWSEYLIKEKEIKI